MKYVITESQFKRLVERGPNSPAYRGPEGYDDSCDCYIDEESKEEKHKNKPQFDIIFSKILKVPIDDSLIGKIKNKFGEDLDSISRLILVAIKENKVDSITQEDIGTVLKIELKHFSINDLPITIEKVKKLFSRSFGSSYEYTLDIPFFGVRGDISDGIGKKIWNSLVV